MERRKGKGYWHADPERDGEHALWVRVKGIGYVGAVYIPPTGVGPTVAEFTRIVKQLAVEAKGFMKAAQVVIAGDFNARIGEMENNVGRKEVRQRRSEDLEVDGRGKALMKAMNRSGMYVVNGVKDKADYTYECRTGGSVIDLLWVPEATKAGVCEEWAEASCCIGDHALVAVEIQGSIKGKKDGTE